MKKTVSVVTFAFAVFFSTHPAMATFLDNQDLAFAFGSENVAAEIEVLSKQEMVETEGERFIFGVPGAAVGGTIYTGSILYKSWDSSINYGFNSNTLNNFIDNWSVNDFLWATGSGFVGSTYSTNMFRYLGYNNFRDQWNAPLSVQRPIRAGGAALGFATFGVHGATSTNFQNRLRSNFSYQAGNIQCYSCYRSSFRIRW